MKSKTDNIAEYILHLWQMEDMVRAFADDPALQQNTFLSDLLQMMRLEGVMDHGHVQIAQNALAELEDLHAELQDTEATYRAAVLHLQPQLNILKSKSDNPTQSDLSMMFVFLYNIMLLHLQKRHVSSGTDALRQEVSRLLAYLSKTYKENSNDDQTAL
ncbi:MAG: DUF4924 family protein [Paludibacteraceae bacterium]|nr:DUF4924 family protein [Paludibacteraceae bacterium]